MTWSFPGLFRDSDRQLVLPTYLAHLFGKDMGDGLALDLACAYIESSRSAMAEVHLAVRLPVYASESQQTVMIAPHGRTTVCINPSFDFEKLYALHESVPGRVELAVQSQAGVDLSTGAQDIVVAPVNDFAWTAPGFKDSDLRALSVVYVTPHDPSVDRVQRMAFENSVYGHFGGGDVYRRSSYTRTASLGPGESTSEQIETEDDEEVQWKIESVTGSDDARVDVSFYGSAAFAASSQGTTVASSSFWPGCTTGSSGSAAPDEGSYVLSLQNSSPSSVTVAWSRSNTREDIVRDVLSAIYRTISQLGTKYSNIPSTYFMDWQYIRLPSEVVASQAANCIDGTLLFASAIELIGMEPVIIYATGHAFVGVRSTSRSSHIWAIETTGVGDTSAEDAYAAGQRERVMDSLLDNNYAEVDVRSMRERGALPLPQ